MVANWRISVDGLPAATFDTRLPRVGSTIEFLGNPLLSETFALNPPKYELRRQSGTGEKASIFSNDWLMAEPPAGSHGVILKVADEKRFRLIATNPNEARTSRDILRGYRPRPGATEEAESEAPEKQEDMITLSPEFYEMLRKQAVEGLEQVRQIIREEKEERRLLAMLGVDPDEDESAVKPDQSNSQANTEEEGQKTSETAGKSRFGRFANFMGSTLKNAASSVKQKAVNAKESVSGKLYAGLNKIAGAPSQGEPKTATDELLQQDEEGYEPEVQSFGLDTGNINQDYIDDVTKKAAEADEEEKKRLMAEIDAQLLEAMEKIDTFQTEQQKSVHELENEQL
ncbi:hypothetical protein ABW19_dt0207743 [Dactylella cylindrospora]|nr:hypothetical protein ABW19_dt0207743 [Dactylella cylindrospora]